MVLLSEKAQRAVIQHQKNKIAALEDKVNTQKINIATSQTTLDQNAAYIQDLKSTLAKQEQTIEWQKLQLDELKSVMISHVDEARGQWQCVSKYFEIKQDLEDIHEQLIDDEWDKAKINIEKLLESEFDW